MYRRSWQQFYCLRESRVRVRTRDFWHAVLYFECNRLVHTCGWEGCDRTNCLWHIFISSYIRWHCILYFERHCLLLKRGWEWCDCSLYTDRIVCLRSIADQDNNFTAWVNLGLNLGLGLGLGDVRSCYHTGKICSTHVAENDVMAVSLQSQLLVWEELSLMMTTILLYRGI